MDLATVKAAVKTWEKTFRAKEGRNPTKDDIKKDPGNIASQYSLYRKLSKNSSSSAASQSQTSASSQLSSSSRSLQPPSSSTAIPSSSSSSQYRSTPSNIPSAEYPTTPTPPARKAYRTSFSSKSQAGPSRSNGTSHGNGSNNDATHTGGKDLEGGRSLKRKASKSMLSNDSSPSHPLPLPTTIYHNSNTISRTLFSTPKKSKGYIGPIHDPNPVNPFTIASSSSPAKSPFLSSSSKPDVINREKSFSSPFIHASSPKKLKEVLEANSLRKVKERNGGLLNEITPRTRARKRLKGEQVEDTPLKEKLPIRKRGQAQNQNQTRSASQSEEPLDDIQSGSNNYITNPTKGIFDEEEYDDEEDEEEDRDEDELGPSPMKTLGKGRGFTSLFGEAEITKNNGLLASNSQLSSTKSTGPDHKIRQGLKKTQDKTKLTKKGSTDGGIMNFFNRTGKSTLPVKKQEPFEEPSILNQNSAATSPEQNASDIQIQPSPPPLLEPTPSTEEILLIEQSPSPVEDIPKSPDHTPSKSSSQRRREKILNLSDDEIDEFDPEGGYVKRAVKIVPTRREIKRRNSSDFSDEEGLMDVSNGAVEIDDDDDLEDEQNHGYIDVTDKSANINANITDNTAKPTSASSPSISSSLSTTKKIDPHTLSIPMLNLLSITSPSKSKSKSKAQLDKAKLEELRYKAIFDLNYAKELKTLKKGQDVAFAGESRTKDLEQEENDQDILEKYEYGIINQNPNNSSYNDVNRDKDNGNDDHQEDDFQDDDWENESDGWLREQTEEDW
ncbi:uncharacterized protein L201_002699 [Kwoniella dendrophila CBS 6074]|uniref:DNA replication regulator SLD2 n=1 Tax=Kwoniella dendrophila CBS 6074 TaxID=1295534 RepID=A0AAX4JT67_9TREE